MLSTSWRSFIRKNQANYARMKRAALFASPELLWLLFYVLAAKLAGRNLPPTDAGNTFLERACPVGAVLTVGLTFSLFLVPGVHRGWLLARVALAVLLGLNACLFKLAGAINYNDTRNSGTYGFWLYGLLASGLVFVPGTILVLIGILRTR